MMRLDAPFVAYWGGRYEVNERETHLFSEVGPAVARRGWYEKAELAEVGEWKSPRARRRLAENSSEDVRDITRLSFAAPDRLRHRVLGLLHGVGDPMASALLTVWDPTHYTVLDFRVVRSLRRVGDLPGQEERPDYPIYLEYCRAVAVRLKVSLRELDRALWQQDKETLPL
jgi:hypothetical protein